MSHRRAALLIFAVMVAALLGLLFAPAVQAMPVQFFYVPFPEDQLLTMMDAISSDAVNPITNYVTITASADNTIIYYDQWENGYDTDIAHAYNVYSTTNPGGTQIWGDQNVANGAAPGVTTNAGDIINAGTTIQLTNNVTTTTRQSVIDFDGGDKIAATKTIVMTRTSWAGTTGTLMAGCVEVFDTNDWGTDYRAPVGANATDNYQMFEYTALSIMAGQDGATVYCDSNNDGDYADANDLNGVVLKEGQSVMATGVQVGAHVVTNHPVQVDIFTGDIGSTYESRDSALLPTTMYGNSYYTPVSTPDTSYQGDERTTAWLYNPNAYPLSIAYQRRDTSGNMATSSVQVAAGSCAKQILDNATDGTGSHFSAVTTGAIATDASATYTTGTAAAGSATISVTTGTGPNRVMLVAVALAEDNTQYNVSSVTYGGTALTLKGRIESGAGASNTHAQVELWALANPTSGTANVVVTLGGNRAFVVGVTTYTGVDVSNGLTSALGSFVSASATTGNNPTVNLTTTWGQVVCDVVGTCSYGGTNSSDPGTFTLGANQTSAWTMQIARTAARTSNGFRIRGQGSYETTTGATTTMSWTIGNPSTWPWAIGAIPLKPAATYTTGNFYGYSTTDSASSNTSYNSAFDWSFTLIPQWMLTTQVKVALGIGRDPTSTTNPTENGNPMWVTPVGNGDTAVTVYVDYDGDNAGAYTDPTGHHYDTSYSLKELQQARIYDPSGDQTGMLAYTLGLNPSSPNANIKLAAAWGQDPLTASASAPGLDCGTSVVPMPEYTAGKDGLLYRDNDGDGFITCGDEIEWPIAVLNVSRMPVPGLVVTDTIPPHSQYVAGSTTLWTDTNGDGVVDTSQAIADDVVGVNGKTTTFPLDEGGYNYGSLKGALASGDIFTIKFRVTIDSYASMGGADAIYNYGHALALGWDDPVDDRVYLRARLGDFIWFDDNSNGIQDATEGGIPGVTVDLLDSNRNIVYTPEGVKVTATTDDTGKYDFKGLLPASYILSFELPASTHLTTANVGTNDAIDSDADPTSKEVNVTLTGGQTNLTVDAGICEDSVSPSPTLAVIGDFGAAVAGGRVAVGWQTLSEAKTAGFYLERKDGDTWNRVNEKMLPALFESPSGGWYAVADDSALPGQTLTYRLTEVEISGRELMHGPFEVTALGSLPDPQEVDEIAGGRQDVRVPKLARSNVEHGWFPWIPPSRPAGVVQLRIETTEAGLYRIDAADVAAGLGVTASKARDLIRTKGVKLTNRGKTVAYLQSADNSSLYFYAQALDSIFTDANVYWLSLSKGTVMSAGSRAAYRGTLGTSFVDTAHAEKNLLTYTPVFHDPDGDYWFWNYLTADWPSGDTQTVDIETPGAIEGQTLTVSLVGITTVTRASEHHVQVSLNGTPLGSSWWSGSTRHDAQFSIPAGLLVAGTNHVDITAVLDPGIDHSVFALDYVDLSYQRATTAVGGTLVLTAGATGPTRVDGLSTPDVWVFDVGTNPSAPQLLKPTSSGGGSGNYWVTISTKAGVDYLVTTASAALLPTAITPVATSRFSSSGGPGADYIIITNPELAAAAQRLADYRASRGMKAMVVTTSEIYDSFNFGIPSPHAIQSFIAYATTKLRPAPSYIVLAGDGSYDYKNYMGYGDSLVPPLMVDTDDGLKPSDARLADLKGDDGVPEIAIGRIPVQTSAELDTVRGKIQAYESAAAGSWQRSVLLAADNADDGGSFNTDADGLAATLPSSLSVVKAYLDDLDLASARALLLGGFNSNLLIDFIGHSGTDQWTDEGLLKNGDVSTLPGGATLPIVNALTCAVGQFAVPGGCSLSETLLKQSNAGAIAVFAPTALEESDQSVQLGTLFAHNLFSSSHSVYLGKSILTTLRAAASAGLPAQLLETYGLLGDPALKVKW